MQKFSIFSKRVQRNFGYTLAALSLTLLLFFGLLSEFDFDIHYPFHYGDVIFSTFIIKSLIQGEWLPYSLIHSKMGGAPFEMNLGDFPVVENLHFILIKFLSFFHSDPVVIHNFYFLLSYCLTTLTFFYLTRQLRIHVLTGLVLSLLFSFLPFHGFRYSHLFLATYFLIPLNCLVLLKLWNKKPLFFKYRPSQVEQGYQLNLKSSQSIQILLLSFLTGTAGAYYSYFFCFFTLIAGLSATAYRKSKYHFLSTALIIITVVSSSFLCVLPNILYQEQHGKNLHIANRDYTDAETFGLKMKNLLVPNSTHRIAKLAAIRQKYQKNPYGVEGSGETVGLIGILGFSLILSRMIFLRRRNLALDKLSLLWISGTLLSVVGGFGVLVAAVFLPQIRGYNRISVYLAAFALLAVGFALQFLKTKLPRLIFYLLVITVGCIGVYDQVTPILKGAYRPVAAGFEIDHRFIQNIENQLPKEAMILQLPYMDFPESPPIHGMPTYHHFQAGLHSKHLRWSYGVSKGRPEALAIQKVSTSPFQISDIRSMGYHGVYIDRTGYPDHGKAVEEELAQKLGQPPLVSENQRLSFFRLN